MQKNKQQLYSVKTTDYGKKLTRVGKRLQVQGGNSIMPAIKNDHLLNLSSMYALSE